MLSVAAVGIEDEDGTVFEGDLDRLAGFGALVEQVETRFPIVGRNPFADGLPRGFDGFERVDIEGRIRWRWDVDDRLMSLPLHPSGCLRQSMSAPLGFRESLADYRLIARSDGSNGLFNDSCSRSGVSGVRGAFLIADGGFAAFPLRADAR